MKIRILFSVVCALVLAACASDDLKQLSASEKREQLGGLRMQQAVEYMKARNYRQALVSIEEAVAAAPKNEAVWLVRADIYQSLKINDKAEESFRRALSLNPTRGEVNNNYGWFVCSVLNRPADSLPIFDRALADPTYPHREVAYMNKGICTSRMGQYNLADAYFERSLAALPSFVPVHKEIARNDLAAGRADEAEAAFARYQSGVDTLNAADLLLGWQIASALGRAQAAEEYAEQLRLNFPYSDEYAQVRRN